MKLPWTWAGQWGEVKFWETLGEESGKEDGKDGRGQTETRLEIRGLRHFCDCVDSEAGKGPWLLVHKDERASLSFGYRLCSTNSDHESDHPKPDIGYVCMGGGVLIIDRTEGVNQTASGKQDVCHFTLLPFLQTDVRRTIYYEWVPFGSSVIPGHFRKALLTKGVKLREEVQPRETQHQTLGT